MAGFIPNAWVARVLEATVGKTAITTASVYLGLATGLPADPYTATLSNIQEVATPGYLRKVVPAFDAATLVALVKITTPTTFNFDPVSADMSVPVNFAFLCDVSSGTSGILRYVFELAEPLLVKNGEPVTVPANTLILE